MCQDKVNNFKNIRKQNPEKTESNRGINEATDILSLKNVGPLQEDTYSFRRKCVHFLKKHLVFLKKERGVSWLLFSLFLSICLCNDFYLQGDHNSVKNVRKREALFILNEVF